MIAELSELLLETTLATSIAALFVLLLRRPLRRAVGARGAYALWLLLPIAGLGVILPARTVTLALPEARPVSILPIRTVAAMDIEQPFDAQPLLIALWSAGVLGLGLVLAWQQRRFRRALGRLRTRDDGSWQAERVDAGPAVIGLWRGRIVLPSDFESRYTELERDLVLRHERVHLARRDPLANLAAAALRCLYWFNPLLHYAVGRFRFDQELAADATVLAQRPEARRSYADAMLKTQLMFDPPPLGCHWQSAHPLKERIAMLKQPLPGAVRLAAGFIFAVLLSAATGYAAWAAQPAQTVLSETSRDQGAAMVHLFRDGKRVKSAFFEGMPGEQLSIRDGDLTLSFGFDNLQPDTVRVIGEFMQGEELLGRPVLVIKRGTTGTVGIGKMGADGHPTLGAEFEVPPGAEGGASVATIAQPAPEDDGSNKHKPPHYPADALKRRAQGTVVLKIKVSREGRALESELDTEVSTPGIDAQLVEAAREHAMTWTFDPARNSQGEAEEGWVSVPITFKVDNDEPSAKSSPLPTPPPRLVAVEEGNSVLPTYRRISPPKYPKAAIEEEREGKVLLRVLIGADGVVQQVDVEETSGSSDLDEAAKAAVRNWAFNAAHDGYKAVSAWVGVPVDFSLDKISSPGAAAPGVLDDIYVRPQQSTGKIEPPSGLNFGWTDPASGRLGWVESGDQC